MKAEFIPIKDYEGFYEISREGVIRAVSKQINRRGRDGSLHTIFREEKLLTPKKRGAYLAVQLYKNGKKCYKSIHRLVAEAFIPNPFNYPQVNHKDENKLNNSDSNLEWCSSEYNQIYSRGKWITLKNPEGELITMQGIKKFCREHHLRESSVYRLFSGKQKQVNGWRLP